MESYSSCYEFGSILLQFANEKVCVSYYSHPSRLSAVLHVGTLVDVYGIEFCVLAELAYAALTDLKMEKYVFQRSRVAY